MDPITEKPADQAPPSPVPSPGSVQPPEQIPTVQTTTVPSPAIPQPQPTQPSATFPTAQPTKSKKKRVFSLIIIVFLLLTIGYLMYFIATNPARQLIMANNTARKSAVAQIGQALTLYKMQNGQYPDAINSSPQPISKSGANVCLDLVPNYIPTLPVDPALGSNKAVSWNSCPLDYATGYEVKRNENGTITITSPKAEAGETITITE